ncbi:hypothetical protein DXG03_001275 [Asterophora parasitica]|uniref:Uncharacterized protein n=1 Tax=Asterophora parasitica TaxID=117018 RepID=A0A9P7G5P9_9AGAR|nr:hypothetical protein DXG03_001275 [Asterophora parasitica]
MSKPTILQSLLGRPSQTYSFPQEKVYHSTKQDMLRLATETRGQQAPQPTVEHDEADLNALKATNDVRAKALISNRDEGEDNGGGDSDDDDSDRDVFYTPNTSPRTSMATTVRPASPPAVQSTKTSFTHTNTSTTSISSSALDAHSLFSVANSDSTRITSPVQSDSEQRVPRVKAMTPPQVANGHVDQQWAKDVRWLVPTTVKATTTPKRRHSTQADRRNTAQTRTKPNTPMSKSINKMTPSIMSSMTALLEEEELHDTPDMLHHPRSSVLISTPRRSRSRLASNPVPPSNPSSNGKSRSTAGHSLHRRRSRSLGHGSSSQASSSASHNTASTSRAKPSKYASSSANPYDRNSTSLPTFTPGDLPSHGTPGYTSLVLPRAPATLSQTTQRPKGLFSLKHPLNPSDLDGKVDLTLSGVAQTTMASVEVVRGLSGGSSSFNRNVSPSKKLMGLFRRAPSSSPSKSPSGPSTQSRARGATEDIAWGKARDEASDQPLGFTSYRTPPKYVPSGSVLVQVWAVGVDIVDWRLLCGGSTPVGYGSVGGPTRSNSSRVAPRAPSESPPGTPKRSVSLRSTLGRLGGAQQRSASATPSATPAPGSGQTAAAGVGYIPGRSFVGRVLECGWEVGDEVGRRGDWVVGLLDLKKDGLSSLSSIGQSSAPSSSGPSSSRTESNATPGASGSSTSTPYPSPAPSRHNSYRVPKARPSLSRAGTHTSSVPLSLEELAILPICGIQAYRAIRTFAFAFSDVTPRSYSSSADFTNPDDTETETVRYEKGRVTEALDGTRRRRVLVLGGHDGAGALGVQMLVKRGWRVCVHVPFMCLQYERSGLVEAEEAVEENGVDRTKLRDDYCMRMVEERVRVWGGEEVIFDDGEEGDGEDERGPVVRVIDQLCEDGDVFDAVLDTVGGKEVWEASERLLMSVDGADAAGIGNGTGKKEKEKTKRVGIGLKQFTTLVGDTPGRPIPSAGDNFKAGLRSLNFGRTERKMDGKVGYAWVNHAQDVDWEGEDISESLGAVLRTVVDEGIRPWVGQNLGASARHQRVVPLEKAPQAFISGERGLLTDGGTVVVKVVG